MALTYMQDDRHFVPPTIDATGNMYVSGYSEGKMSPQVDVKPTPPREFTPPTVVEVLRQPEPVTRVEIAEMVHREDIYPGPRKSSAGWQRESYEQMYVFFEQGVRIKIGKVALKKYMHGSGIYEAEMSLLTTL